MHVQFAKLAILVAAINVFVALFAEAARGEDDQPAKVDFEKLIWPILESRCFDCHDANEQEGKLRLDAREALFAGGVSGKSVAPGNADDSLLIQRILGKGDHPQMPLDEDPLEPTEIALLKTWIDQGAGWPDGVGATVQITQPHWAYLKPQRQNLPAVKNRIWPASPIDYFVLAQLEAKSLTPSQQAAPGKLIRRVSLDLIGLPPSIELVERFERSPTFESYCQIVDELLASPQYGEKWARGWLDLARYADTNGFQADQFRSIWPYRDWVIRAFNNDMPFDQFTIEQLAGDLLENATIDQKIASGFHRLTTCNVEAGVDPEENRVNQVIDRVNTTGTAWLGTTLECMQCHNHKYDPFTQKEYYQLFAFFNNTSLEVKGKDTITYEFFGPKMPLPLDAEQAASRSRLERQIQNLELKVKNVSAEHMKQFAGWLDELESKQSQSPDWQVLKILRFQSTGGSKHEVLDDQSVLVSGSRADKDTYEIVCEPATEHIRALKLEALTHESLPGGGPGRHDVERPNFVATELKAFLVSGNADAVPIKLTSAAADFSQQKWDVAGLIDGKPDTGWAINPQFGKPHYATMLCELPREIGKGDRFKIVINHDYGGTRTIGRIRLSVTAGLPERMGLPEPVKKVLKVPSEKRSPQQQKQLEEYYLSLAADVAALKRELASAKQAINQIQPMTTLVMVEDSPRENAVFKRGNFLLRGEPVSAATPRALHEFNDRFSRDRLGLANWIVDPNNPLTARVTVNRWWAEFFGHGIVLSQEDFGTQSEPPTHPALLDWLALKLIDNWSMKEVHREIVLSNTYRQSSKVTQQSWQADPRNRLYARGPRLRLPAEVIRDNALTISGILSDKMCGPPVFPPQPDNIWRHVGRNAPKYETSVGGERFRRGLYVFWRRSAPYPSFVNFDAPDRAACVVARPLSNTPLQALTLLNDPAYAEIAAALADRVLRQETGDVMARLRYAFQLCTARQPDESELKELLAVHDMYRERMGADPKRAAQVVSQGKHAMGNKKRQGQPSTESDDTDNVERATWFFVANVLLNLDETITKE